MREIALDLANAALAEFGQQEGPIQFTRRAPAKRVELWGKLDIDPRGIDREISEDCVRCAEVCPEEAITLTPVTKGAPKGEYLNATFDLLRCQRCDGPFTTGRIVDKLLALVPQEFQTDAADLSWVRLCPDCRQLTEGEKVAKEWIMSRWPGTA